MEGVVVSIESLTSPGEDAARILDVPPRVIDMLPMAIYACAADGRIRWFNKRAALCWGREPRLGDDADLFCGSFRIFSCDSQPIGHQDAPMARVLQSGMPIHGEETVIERPDGSRLAAMVHIDPIKDADGTVLGAINCFHGVSALERARRTLHEREQWFQNILEALPAAIYTTDAAGRVTFYNQAAVELSGREPKLGSDEWCVTWRLFQPDGTPMLHSECPMAIALREDRPIRGAEAQAERPDGSRLTFMPYPTPLHASDGKLVGAVNMLVDITRRRQSEQRLALLAREVDHRSKNMLAVIQAMVRFTRASTVSEFASAVLGRISALAHAHTLLSESRWNGADLRRLAEEELAPYRSDSDSRERVQIDGDQLALAPAVAQSLALVLHELTTNAAKHGALSMPTGQIRIEWSRGENGGLALRWSEQSSAAVRAPKQPGFGMKVIERTVTDQLDGAVKLDWAPTGLVCLLDIPAGSLVPLT